MTADIEFNLLTAVIPVLYPGRHIKSLLDILRETNRLGIQTIFIVDEFVKNSHEDDAAVEAIRTHNQGLTKVISGIFGNPGAARNAALEHISSKWVTFWDSDDTLFPEKYKQSVIKFPEVDLIVGGYEERNTDCIRSVLTTDLRELAFSPGLWRLIIKVELLESKKFREFSMGEDQLLLMELRLDRKSVVYVNEVFYSYHTNIDGQLTRSQRALKDLPETARLASEIAQVSTTTSYLRVIAMRLFLAMLRQPSVPLGKKIKVSSIFIRPKFVPTFFYILKKRIK